MPRSSTSRCTKHTLLATYGDRNGRPVPPKPLSAVAGEIGGQVEPARDRVVLHVAPELARHRPHDLELDAVGIPRVQRLADAVVALADQRAEVCEPAAHIGEVADRIDLPREVIEAGAAGVGPGHIRSD